MLRLDKYLAHMGAGTRQQVKKLIRQGKVTVDGVIVKEPEYKVNAATQSVSLEEQPVAFVSYEYFMLNKPAGVVSATQDANDRTVIELIESRVRQDLFPVGRLDKDTEGLLLITNDGALAHRLLAPKKHVDKTYYARIKGAVTAADAAAFERGVNIGTAAQEEWTAPGRLEIIKSGDISEIRLTIQEGKYHQVKRMFQAVSKEVLYLKRESMGSLTLDETLSCGAYRSLTDEELNNL